MDRYRDKQIAIRCVSVCVCVCVCVYVCFFSGRLRYIAHACSTQKAGTHTYLPILYIYLPIYLYKHTSTDAKQCVADIQVISSSTLTNVFFQLLCTLHSILNCSSCLVLSPITGIHLDAVKFTTAHSLVRFNNTLP